MTTVIKFGPFDPGRSADEMHGCKSYKFWRQAELDTGIAAKISWPAPKSLAHVYLLLQLFLHFFFDYVRRVAITVKIIHSQQHRVTSKQIGLPPPDDVAPKSLAPKSLAPNLFTIDENQWQCNERNFGAGFLARIPNGRITKQCTATSCSTTVFEVAKNGLGELLQDIKQEIRQVHGNMSSLPIDSSVLACCELIWSVPSGYRTYWTEQSLEHEADRLMRANDQQAAIILGADPFGRHVQPGGIEQRIKGPDGLGVYRRFYPELVKMACTRAQDEHGKVWRFDERPMPVDLQWPVIGQGLATTTVVFLNLIFLKF